LSCSAKNQRNQNEELTFQFFGIHESLLNFFRIFFQMNFLQQQLQVFQEKVLLQKNYHTVLSIIKGFRNGAVYGAKIRFPHSLVMTFLFRSDKK
jgi:hypothetical protein